MASTDRILRDIENSHSLQCEFMGHYPFFYSNKYDNITIIEY